MSLFDPQRRKHLPLETLDRAALDQRLLKNFEPAANAADQLALAAEIDRMLPAVLTIAEAIVGAERFAVAVAPTGGDAALAHE